jgi:hypothetical protein
VYGSTDDDPDEILPSPKRRIVDPASNGSVSGSVHQISPVIGHINPSPQIPQWTSVAESHRLVASELQDGDSKTTAQPMGIFAEGQREVPKAAPNVPDADSALISGGSVSERDEEAVVYNYTRMLQDPSGRLCK